MARQINSVTLVGRLTKDPAIKTVGETVIGSFTLAVGRGKNSNKEEVSDFISCKCFGKLASDIVGKYAKQGQLVAIQGRIQTGSYEDKETGKKIYTTEVVFDEFTLCGGGKKDDNSAMNSVATDSDSSEPEELPFA